MSDIVRQTQIEKFVKKNGEILYHYTSTGTLLGILQNRELWLGTTATMNDKTEITCFLNTLKDAVYNVLSDSPKKLCEVFFTKVFQRLSAEVPYAICFSKLKDNAAQWERYADNGSGVCIEFNTYALRNLFYNENILFNEVFYEWKIEEHDHYHGLIKYFNTAEIPFGMSDEKGLIDNILGCAYLYKHKSFCSEQEIRIVTLWSHIINDSTSDFVFVNQKIRKVLKVNLEKLCEDKNILLDSLFSKIVIGPRSGQNLYELQEFISSLGFKKLADNVIISDCPLR